MFLEGKRNSNPKANKCRQKGKHVGSDLESRLKDWTESDIQSERTPTGSAFKAKVDLEDFSWSP